MATVAVAWDDAAVQVACRSPSGPVARAMSRLADGLVLSMKYRCPVYTGPPRRPAPRDPAPRRPGTLRSSIRKIRQPDGSYLIGPTDTVGDPPRLLGPMIEHGTPPHEITVRTAQVLYSSATGQFFGRRVMHPGTRPHPFVAPAVRDLDGTRIRAV